MEEVTQDLYADPAFIRLEDHLHFFELLSNETRFVALYLLYKHEQLSVSALEERTGREGDALYQHLKKLENFHLISNAKK